jgi:hypothetical protein
LSARKSLLCFVVYLAKYLSSFFLILSTFYCSDDEEENPPIDVAARTSTSCTLVVSDVQPDVEETSPPQQNVEHPTPPASPHVPSPKRARVEPAPESALQPGGSATPLLDNVSCLLLLFCIRNYSVPMDSLHFFSYFLLSTFLSYSTLSSLFPLSALDAGIHPPWYPICRVPRLC